MKPLVFVTALGLAAAIAAGCGTIPPAVFEVTSAPAVAQDGQAVIRPATATPRPTNTPTPTNTPLPTPTPTLEPTVEPTPTVVAAEPAGGEVVIGGPNFGADDPLKFTVDNFGNAARGEALFNQTFNIDGAEWACTSCHNVVGDEVKIGPSLHNIALRAGERVPGEGPYTYIYNSIHAPQAYIVPEFVGMTLMPNYSSVLTASQIYDLTAYLLTLHD
jgi:hypothetical protein